MIKKMTIVDLLVCIMNNTQPKEILIEDLNNSCDSDVFYWMDEYKEYHNKRGETAGVSLSEKTIRDVIVEYEVSILTKKEKQYLSNIIKPFRNKIIAVIKQYTGPDKEYIEIVFEDYDSSVSFIDLPPFDENTMYIGMEASHRYSLKELEL